MELIGSRTPRGVIYPLAILLVLLTCSACSPTKPEGNAAAGSASPTVMRAHADNVENLNFAETQDFDDAKRGFVAKPSGKVMGADGSVIWDFDAFAFEDGKAPDTADPSLWRHAQLNNNIGLFKVTQGVYQLRGFDQANMTLIEGKTGWIVVDALSANETAVYALEFARKQLGNKPVSALIVTHAHIDHFGGMQGVVTPKELAAHKIPVVAPAAFMEEAISENIMMDAAMGRRAMYQFGKNLPRNATGILDTGLGKGQAFGSFGILPPNQLISEQTQKLQIDGVDFVFHNVPGAECPAELSFSVPALKLYDGAEILAQTMHNLLPIRGAKVRDGLLWSTYLDQALEQSKDADIYMASHNWPVFGNANIQKFITVQRDVFKYTHDQTVRLMNEGYTPREITAMVKLPKALTSYFGARGYYGDLRHNVKAVYQFYLGNYDGNPANLNLLPPAESGKRYVELIGGADKVIAAGQAAFDKGDYQWAAELLNNAVLADANNKAAKELLARTYEQMGYMSEAATWRNSYLTGAMELRDGPPKKGISKANGIDILEQIPTEFFLTKMAASLDGPGADGKSTKINLTISDKQENWVLWLQNSVLHFKQAAVDPSADASLTLTHGIFVKMIAGTAGIKDTLLSDDLKISGSKIDLIRFFSLIDKPSGTHVIVTR